MAQAMFDIRSPKFFQQYEKRFKFFISETKPILSNFRNYAVCEHLNSSSEFCNVSSPHFHSLVETLNTSSMKEHKFMAVPCLYSSYLYLFADFTSLETCGEILQKLILAVEFNKNNTDLQIVFSSPIHKRLPSIKLNTPTTQTISKCEQFVSKPTRPKGGAGQKTLANMKEKPSLLQTKGLTKAESTQTDFLTHATLERFEKIVNGPHSAVLCKFMDIMLSGYGKIDIDSELLSVKLTYEEKIKY